MKQSTKIRILFAGYAQVHFASFLPIYRELARDPRLEIWFTGGFRTKAGRGWRFDLEGFYDPFELPPERIIPYDTARNRSYHILFCAHLSQVLAPKRADVRVQLFHGVSFKNCAVTPKALKYDYLFVAGDYMRRRFVELELFAEGDPRLVMTGFAKVDRLVDGSLDRDATLSRLGLDPTRKTVLLAPTGHKLNALELHGPELVGSLAGKCDINLLVKTHDHPKDKSYDWRKILARYESDRVRVIWDPDVVPYLHAADLLITDASSVSNEYALLDRPIVFLDVPELLEGLRLKGVPLDLDTWGRKGGLTLRDVDRLPETVDSLLAGEDEAGRSAYRKEITRDVFHRPGTATGRAVEAVRQIVASLDDSDDRHRGPLPLDLSEASDSERLLVDGVSG